MHEVEGVVSDAFNKERILVDVATSAGQKSFCVLGERTTFSPTMSFYTWLAL